MNKSELISWVLLSSFFIVAIATFLANDKIILCGIMVLIGAIKMIVEFIQGRNSKHHKQLEHII